MVGSMRTLAAAVILAALVLAGCGGSDGSSSGADNATSPKLDPTAFAATDGRPNRFFPLTPGYQSVRQGGVNRGDRRLSHRSVVTVTDLTKKIAGIPAVVVLDQDFDGGEIAEQALDYYAQDKRGNVWYLGSYTEAYEGGEFVNANDGWLAGKDDAEAGIMMPAGPKTGTPPFVQAVEPGDDPAVAKVTRTGARNCVPFKCYGDVVVVEEDGSENKYYAPGVGGIRTEPVHKGGEEEVEELVNLTQLSRAGLADISAEALRVDRHAAVTTRDVFGDAAPAQRTG